MTAGLDSFLSQSGVISAPEFEKKGEAIESKRRAAVAPYVEQIKQGAAKRSAIADSMADIKAPEAPKFEELPKEPPMQYRDPVQAMGSLGSVLALLGSLKTRAPLTSALKSGAAAMNAFHKRDAQSLQLEHQQWKDAMDTALDQNKQELSKYHAALEGAHFDLGKAQSQMAAIAAANGDSNMLAGIESGNWDRVMSLLTNREKLGTNLAKFMETAHYHNESIGVSNERNKIAEMTALIKAKQLQSSTLDPATTKVEGLRYLLTGKIPPVGRSNNQTRAELMKEGTAIGHHLGLSDAEITSLPYSIHAQQKALDSMTAWNAGVQRSLISVDKNMDVMMHYAAQLGLGKMKLLNKAIIAGKLQFNDPTAQAYANAAQTVMREYGRAMAGPMSNAMLPVEVLKKGEEMIDKANNVPALQATFDVMKKDMSNVVSANEGINHSLMQMIQNPALAARGSTDFDTVEEAEQAEARGIIHPGDRITVGGRPAVVH